MIMRTLRYEKIDPTHAGRSYYEYRWNGTNVQYFTSESSYWVDLQIPHMNDLDMIKDYYNKNFLNDYKLAFDKDIIYLSNDAGLEDAFTKFKSDIKLEADEPPAKKKCDCSMLKLMSVGCNEENHI